MNPSPKPPDQLFRAVELFFILKNISIPETGMQASMKPGNKDFPIQSWFSDFKLVQLSALANELMTGIHGWMLSLSEL
jgi:hypothetical protein